MAETLKFIYKYIHLFISLFLFLVVVNVYGKKKAHNFQRIPCPDHNKTLYCTLKNCYCA
ncbi:unnamed protein product [Trifolium pratense]|uniref:Uncharacterized protein n=1 Tax=Trifolium pratense TaxID=57577 RepID=A0ACB0LDY6_TRIPR|nr:unnamed protein product [Trifolium pratense]